MGFYDFSAVRLDGEAQNLTAYKGKVLLIVNTASACGFTPQFAGLEALYERYKDQGFEILGFPCNQFGAQEPGDAAQIGDFCQKNYGVSFSMFDKIAVKGPEAHPVYDWLTTEKRGFLGSKAIKWNFTKFLLGRDGQVLKRFGPQIKPEALASAIEAALARS